MSNVKYSTNVTSGQCCDQERYTNISCVFNYSSIFAANQVPTFTVGPWQFIKQAQPFWIGGWEIYNSCCDWTAHNLIWCKLQRMLFTLYFIIQLCKLLDFYFIECFEAFT